MAKLKPKDPPTIVIFRTWRAKPHDTIALFPAAIWNDPRGLCASYQHVGQHAAADYRHVIARTRPAAWSEWQPLYGELRQVGYDNLIARRRYIPRSTRKGGGK